MFHFAPPDVNGFGVSTWTPGLSRSAQVWMPFGLPLRTISTTTELETMPLVGVSAQLSATSPALTSLSTSGRERERDDVGLLAGRPPRGSGRRTRRRTA